MNRMAGLLLGWAFLCLGPSTALANPYWMQMSYGLQVPETMHVQISVMFDSRWTLDLPTAALCGDRVIPFESVLFDFQENTGSGLAEVKALQACDCNLLPGEYNYEFGYLEGVDTWDEVWPIAVTVVSPPPPPELAQTTPEGDEVMPWDIPSPPWPKGLDCVAWCLDHGEADGGGPEATGDLRPGPDGADQRAAETAATDLKTGDGTLLDGGSGGGAKKGSGGCASAPGAPVQPPILLAVLALLALVRVRRSSRIPG
jgi:MYXO-CTERM domain-containing protein